jgi:hypothetical protein
MFTGVDSRAAQDFNAALIALALTHGGGGGGTPGTETAGIYNIVPGTVSIGDAVHISAADTVVRAQANSSAGFAVGIVTLFPTSTTAIVVYNGEASVFAGLTPGARYFLSPTTPGGVTTVAPSAPGQIVQLVGVAKDATTMVAGIIPNYIQL